jgi:hypothetical protein
MPHFILFFGILINAAEHCALYVIEDHTDKHGILVCVPKGDADTYHVPLPVPYDQARAEWEATLKSPPASHAHTH